MPFLIQDSAFRFYLTSFNNCLRCAEFDSMLTFMLNSPSYDYYFVFESLTFTDLFFFMSVRNILPLVLSICFLFLRPQVQD